MPWESPKLNSTTLRLHRPLQEEILEIHWKMFILLLSQETLGVLSGISGGEEETDSLLEKKK